LEDIRHYCGLFGIVNHPDAAELAYLGMYAQQHRGQEGAGICTSDGEHIIRRAGQGLVGDAMSAADLKALTNRMAVGHVRYSTTGSCSESNLQPLLVNCSIGQVGLCHNGNLVNAAPIRSEYESHGHIFMSTSDTEVILHMLADKYHAETPDPLASVLRQIRGSYCLLIHYPDRIEAVRDPSGNRPLCLGRLGDSWIVASETCALDIIPDAQYVRDVQPGEIVTLGINGGMQSRCFVESDATRRAYCVFEHIYFADPSSDIFGENVHMARKAMGAALAREHPVDGDIVVPVPNCARCAAMGYSEASGIPLGRGFTTNHYVGRSFIQPTQRLRDIAVRLKLNPIRASVKDKRLIVVEDSVVRGTTTRGKMQSLRDAGAKEIHLRVASPPIRHPCHYGIDFPRHEELIATGRSVDQVRDFLGVDSLAYLSLDGMLACTKPPNEHFCTACFSGEYPIPIDPNFEKDMFERKQLRFFDDVGAKLVR
jgi:amidophosphoribosyltransferase